MPSYNMVDTLYIYDTQLPYTYNDTVFGADMTVGLHNFTFNYKTISGCDSTVHFTLGVIAKTGIAETAGNTFQLYPNPIKRGGKVFVNATFTDAEKDGLTVEVFNAIGECVLTEQPKSYPIEVSAFDASGVYMVRITTGIHEVKYGKVIVK